MVLDNERHKTWKFTVREIGGGGICHKDRKEIVIDPDSLTPGLILHEIAHIKNPKLKCIDDISHHGIFADEFTRIVNKYCIPKEWQ